MSGSHPRGPDFLVIGAQRAGTTWLHRVLRQHPALWLPPVKELHYFDKLDIKRTILDEKERRRVGLSGLRTPDFWHARYWLLARNDAWYARLFGKAQQQGFIAGEITPAYATLNEDMFRRIHRMNPNVKLVFVMREPMERAWSAVNNANKKGQVDGGLTVDNAVERARAPGAAARSAYLDTIGRVEAIFPKAQLHCCFFDDLRDRPEAFAAEILSFLGAEPDRVTQMELPKAVNVAAGQKPLPQGFVRRMLPEYLPMVQALSDRFGGPPRQWRARYESMLSGASE